MGGGLRVRPGEVSLAHTVFFAAGSYTTALLATRLGIRWWTSLPSPCVLETPDGPPPYVGGLLPSTGRWDSLQHAAARRLTRLFKRGVQPQCLQITRGGHPSHPLMLRNDCRLKPFSLDAIQEAMHGR